VKGLTYNFQSLRPVEYEIFTQGKGTHTSENFLYIKKKFLEYFAEYRGDMNRSYRIQKGSGRRQSYRCQCHFQSSSGSVIGLVWNVREPDDQGTLPQNGCGGRWSLLTHYYFDARGRPDASSISRGQTKGSSKESDK
jgi:hypothetical protein